MHRSPERMSARRGGLRVRPQLLALFLLVFLAGGVTGVVVLQVLRPRERVSPGRWVYRNPEAVTPPSGAPAVIVPGPTPAPAPAPSAQPPLPEPEPPPEPAPLPTVPSPPPVTSQPSPLPESAAGDPSLQIPVVGIRPEELPDNYHDMRGTMPHNALDVMAPRGTPVVAVEEGPVRKLFTSKKGGLTVYQFSPDGKYCYYYAHLDAYAPGLKEGQWLRRGQQLGTVGTSGNAPPNAPHLHFQLLLLGPEKRWWEGTPVNPHPLMVG